MDIHYIFDALESRKMYGKFPIVKYNFSLKDFENLSTSMLYRLLIIAKYVQPRSGTTRKLKPEILSTFTSALTSNLQTIL